MAAKLSLDDFDIGQLIGKGGFSNVYRATNRSNRGVFAVKVMSKALLEDFEIAQRIRQEITIHQKLKHAGVVSLEEVLHDDHNIYLILEHFGRRNLFQHLKVHGPLTETVASKVIFSTLKTVCYLHNNGIIHRDLKLSNILVDMQGEEMVVKLCDFGLSKMVHHPDEEHHTLCGTPNYLAPEIIQGSAHSYPVDIFALGCLYFGMIFGSIPPRLEKGITNEHLLDSLRGAEISPESVDFMEKCLAEEAAKRPPAAVLLKHPLFVHGPSKANPIVESPPPLDSPTAVEAVSTLSSAVNTTGLSEISSITKEGSLTSSADKSLKVKALPSVVLYVTKSIEAQGKMLTCKCWLDDAPPAGRNRSPVDTPDFHASWSNKAEMRYSLTSNEVLLRLPATATACGKAFTFEGPLTASKEGVHIPSMFHAYIQFAQKALQRCVSEYEKMQQEKAKAAANPEALTASFQLSPNSSYEEWSTMSSRRGIKAKQLSKVFVENSLD